MSDLWHITLLGSLRAQRGDQTITRFRYQKAAGLLAYLAYHLQQAHPREVLIALFWPESEPEAGRASLSTAISSLRNQLEPPGIHANAVLRADRFSVNLNPAAVTTDVQAFEEAIQQASNTSSQTEKLQRLMRAMEQYQGRLLPGFYEEWIASEQERLAGRFFDAASTLIGLLQEQGDLPSALQYARQAVSIDPVREEAQAHLMRLLVAVGQPGAALRQYKELERLLDAELGSEPSVPLRALARQIEKQTGLSAPPLPSSGVAPALPTASSPQSLPSGVPTTVNLLLTDIESSVRLEERTAQAFQAALETYHWLLRQAIARHGGQAIQEAGGSFVALFPSPHSALACAISIQQALNEQEWPELTGSLGVRIALHTGNVEFKDGGYHGPALQRALRILTAGHGGQILVSEATAGLLSRDLEEPVRLVDLGVWRLRDMPAPEHLFQVEYPGMPAEGFGSLAAEAGYQANLPLRLTRFFGRSQEIARITAMLLASQHRLLTLSGTGGTGKTRLALEVADRLLGRFAGAVWFVGLADHADPGLIASALREAMRLPASPQEPMEQVIEALNRQPSLVVLDNFEHLVEGGAGLVQTLLERVAGVTLLVTSRQVLGLSSEREFQVPPLPTPNGPDIPEQLSLYDSVRLFVDRAQAVKPDFQVSSYNAPAVAELCDRLEGIPLAIELAAARTQMMTPAQMLTQLNDRFSFLVSRKRDAVERHQTLRAAIDWSFRLLSSEVQRFFCRLSVFHGGWTVEAAEVVCEEPLAMDYLAALRECSLVFSEETEQGMHYRMLETLREYAQEQLPPEDLAMLGRRHMEYFSSLSFAVWKQNERHWWLNYEAALATAQERQNMLAALQLGWQMEFTWVQQGRIAEGRRTLENLLSHPAAQKPTAQRAFALCSLAILSLFQGNDAVARPLLEESLAIGRQWGNKLAMHIALARLGEIATRRGEYDTAEALIRESIQMSREMGHEVDNVRLGWLALQQGQLDTAQAIFEEADHLLYLARVMLAKGEAERGLTHAEEALRGNRYWFWAHAALALKGQALCRLGHPEAALALLKESLLWLQSREIQNQTAAEILAILAEVEHRLNRFERAVQLYAASIEHFGRLIIRLPSWRQKEIEDDLTLVREALGDEHYKKALAEGQAMTWEQAVAFALVEQAG